MYSSLFTNENAKSQSAIITIIIIIIILIVILNIYFIKAMYSLQDKVILISGSARGIGKYFAKILLDHGAKISLSDQNINELEKTQRELTETYGKDHVTAFELNVSFVHSWESVWSSTESYFKAPIYMLINNAGVGPMHGVESCLNVNLNGTLHGSYLAIHKMKKSNGGSGGRIVNVASMAGVALGLASNISEFGYVISKWGVVSFTRHFAHSSLYENQSENYDPETYDGIKVFAFCPSYVATELLTEDPKSIKLSSPIMKLDELHDRFLTMLKLDKNGSINLIAPNLPLFDFPCFNKRLIQCVFLFQKILESLGIPSLEYWNESRFILMMMSILLIVFLLGFSLLYVLVCCL